MKKMDDYVTVQTSTLVTLLAEVNNDVAVGAHANNEQGLAAVAKLNASFFSLSPGSAEATVGVGVLVKVCAINMNQGLTGQFVSDALNTVKNLGAEHNTLMDQVGRLKSAIDYQHALRAALEAAYE